MAPNKAISVTLGPQQATLKKHLNSGQYEDASDVVRTALRALEREDAALDELLRAKVKKSLADRQPPISAKEVSKRMRAHHAKMVKAAARDA